MKINYLLVFLNVLILISIFFSKRKLDITESNLIKYSNYYQAKNDLYKRLILNGIAVSKNDSRKIRLESFIDSTGQIKEDILSDSIKSNKAHNILKNNINRYDKLVKASHIFIHNRTFLDSPEFITDIDSTIHFGRIKNFGVRRGKYECYINDKQYKFNNKGDYEIEKSKSNMYKIVIKKYSLDSNFEIDTIKIEREIKYAP